MRPTALVLAAGLSVVLIAGCSSSSSSPNPTAVVVVPTPSSVTPTLPVSIPSLLATGVATSLDPCALITQQEASTLTGQTFGVGKEGQTSGHGNTCVYGASTFDVFTVIVGQAPDIATAQAGMAAAEAEIAASGAKGLKFTQVSGIGDGAAYASGGITESGQTINYAAIYALKGTIFFGFSDLSFGAPAPNAAAIQATAQTMLSRLP